MVNSKAKGWKQYERTAHSILSELNPDKEVTHSIYIAGKLSKGRRQVDIKVGDYDFIAFECKDHGRPIDVPVVEAFNTKLTDIGAKKGAIVSNSGFTSTAVNMATELEIDLLHLVDDSNSDIKGALYCGVLIADVMVKSFGIRITGTEQFLVESMNPKELQFYIPQLHKYSSGYSLFVDLWNNSENLEKVPGSYTYSFPEEDVMLVNKDKSHSKLTGLFFEYTVIRKYYLGKVRIIETRGIYNVQSKAYTTKSLQTEPVTPYKIEVPENEVPEEKFFEVQSHTSMGLEVVSILPEG